MVDIRQELQQRYKQSKEAEQSFTERLGQLDQFNQGTAVPQISSEGPKGYNPMNSLQALFQMITNRKNVASDVSSQKDAGLTLLNLLNEYQQTQEDKEFREKELNLRYQSEAVDPLKMRSQLLDEQKAGVTWNPDTGAFEPGTKISAEKQQVISDIDEVLGRDTGAMTGLPNLFKTGQNITTKAKIEQIKAKLSLEAREKLKGTGQISDYESKMLGNSVAALNPRMSDADFRTELEKIKGILSGTYSSEDQGLLDEIDEALINKYKSLK